MCRNPVQSTLDQDEEREKEAQKYFGLEKYSPRVAGIIIKSADEKLRRVHPNLGFQSEFELKDSVSYAAEEWDLGGNEMRAWNMKSALSGDAKRSIQVEIDALFNNWENPSLSELPCYVVTA
jgi:hypothetical protein